MIDQAARRFLLGTDFVAPKTQEQYLQTYRIYAPLLAESKPEAKSLLLKDNYERIFDQARQRVRAWEKADLLNPTRSAE